MILLNPKRRAWGPLWLPLVLFVALNLRSPASSARGFEEKGVLTASVVGAVVDSTTGLPIPLVRIQARGPDELTITFFTRSDGLFSFSEVPVGMYDITASSLEFISTTQVVNVRPIVLNVVRIEMDVFFLGNAIKGKIRVEGTDTFLVSVPIQAFLANEAVASTLDFVVDFYRLNGLEAGIYEVRAEAEDFDIEPVTVEVVDDEMTESELVATPKFSFTLTLTGTVVDAQTRDPVDGADVLIEPTFGGVGFSTKTNVDGLYLVTIPQSGDYRVEVFAQSFSGQAQGVEISPSTPVLVADFALTFEEDPDSGGGFLGCFAGEAGSSPSSHHADVLVMGLVFGWLTYRQRSNCS